jgi:Bacterial PH domain
VRPDVIEVVWPLKRRRIPREDIASVRILQQGELRREVGWGARVGAGGLWGGFGWLWTSRRGIVQMYVSQTDQFVWIEHKNNRPWLITPEEPEAFVRAVSS